MEKNGVNVLSGGIYANFSGNIRKLELDKAINAKCTGFQANVNVAQTKDNFLDQNGELDSSTHGRQLGQKLGDKFTNVPSPLTANKPEAALIL